MIYIFVITLIIFFQISIFIHISFLAGHISSKSKKDLNGFLVTTVTNMLIGLILAVIVLVYPESVRDLPMDLILTLEAGLFFFLLLFVKFKITLNIIKKMKNPDNFHLNYFGKKVYNLRIVTQKDLAIYFLSIPFALFIGTYFVVKLINTFS